MDYIEREMLMEELINENSRLKKLRRARATLMDGDASEEDKLKANAKIDRNNVGKLAGSAVTALEKNPKDINAAYTADDLIAVGKNIKANPSVAKKSTLNDLNFKQIAKNDRKEKKEENV